MNHVQDKKNKEKDLKSSFGSWKEMETDAWLLCWLLAIKKKY